MTTCGQSLTKGTHDMANQPFSLIGAESVIAQLKEVKRDVRFKGGRFALRKAAKIVEAKAKAGAAQVDDPASDASIEKNITTRFSSRTFKRSGDLMFRVGVMGGAGGNRPSSDFAGLPGGDTRHWRQLEFGNENHAAQPFMRKALSDSIHEVTSTFLTEYDKALGRAIRRAQRQAAKQSTI